MAITQQRVYDVIALPGRLLGCLSEREVIFP